MTAHTIADLRGAARHRLPRMFFDYLDGGSFSETTLRRNVEDFGHIQLPQRVLRNVAQRGLATTFLGQTNVLPLALGPVGFGGMFWVDGEAQAARAANEAGISFCLSTMSIGGLAQVSAASPRPIWFQSYIFRDRSIGEQMLAEATGCGVTTLVLTVDTAVSGVRERDLANGFRIARRLSARAMLDLVLHPEWSLRRAAAGLPKLGNFPALSHLPLMEQASRMTAEIDPSLVWDDVSRLRRQWGGKLVIKGLLSVDDARRAVDAGADGIVVSNHGGRQLDGAASSISMLPSIAAAVGGQIDILLDGGIRRGADVIKALLLGARGVLLGRAYAYGLAANGQAGVRDAIGLIAREMELTMALMGYATLEQLREAAPEVLAGLPGEWTR